MYEYVVPHLLWYIPLCFVIDIIFFGIWYKYCATEYDKSRLRMGMSSNDGPEQIGYIVAFIFSPIWVPFGILILPCIATYYLFKYYIKWLDTIHTRKEKQQIIQKVMMEANQ